MKLILSTLAASLTISALLLGQQYQERTSLRHQIQEAQHQLSQPVTPVVNASHSNPQIQNIAAEHVEIDVVALNSAIETLKKLSETIPDMDQDPTVGLKAIPQILETVAHLNSREIFEIIRAFSDSPNPEADTGFTNIILVSVVSESDPISLLNSDIFKARGMRGIKAAALASLIRKDRKAALDWYHQSANQLGLNEKDQMNRAMVGGLMKQNLREGMAFLKTLTEREQLDAPAEILGSLAMDSEKRTEMIEILKEMDDTELRRSILKNFYGAIFISGDENGLQDITQNLSLRSEVQDGLMMMGAQSSLRAGTISPLKILSWLQEHVSQENQAPATTKAIAAWAQKDIKAAGEWLQKQEISPIRNAAIQGYVHTIVRVNPQAAMDWAEQISDPTKKQNTLQNALRHWHRHEAEAAEAWRLKKGLPEKWLKRK